MSAIIARNNLVQFLYQASQHLMAVLSIDDENKDDSKKKFGEFLRKHINACISDDLPNLILIFTKVLVRFNLNSTNNLNHFCQKPCNSSCPVPMKTKRISSQPPLCA